MRWEEPPDQMLKVFWNKLKLVHLRFAKKLSVIVYGLDQVTLRLTQIVIVVYLLRLVDRERHLGPDPDCFSLYFALAVVDLAEPHSLLLLLLSGADPHA